MPSLLHSSASSQLVVRFASRRPSRGRARAVRHERPRADDGLEDEVRLVRVLELRPARGRHHLLRRSAVRAPRGARTSPLRLVSCVVVASRRPARARSGWPVELLDQSEKRRVSADLVQREQADPAVERRVLDALRVTGVVCWKRTRTLVRRVLEQQDPRQLRGRRARRAPRGRPCPRLLPTTARRRCGRRGGWRAPRSSRRRTRFAAEQLGLGRRSRPASSSFASSATSSNGGLAGQLLVEARQRLLARGIDEERSDVVRELVPRRPSTGQSGRRSSPGSRIFSTQIRSTPGARSRSR